MLRREGANRERSANAMSEATSEAVMEPKPNGIPTAKELGFDPAALREKYAAERTRRLRADGNNQYQEITGAHEHYNFDPYVEPGFTRQALQEDLEAVVVGGGFGGLLAAARLQKAGITNIRIIEKGGDFAGPGTGTGIRAPSATLNPTFTCRCSKRPDIFRRRSTPSLPRFSSTRSGSGSTSTFTSEI